MNTILSDSVTAGRAFLLGRTMFFAVAAFVLSVPVHGQETVPDRLRVGTREVPPFAMRSEDGRWTGISIDLMRQIGEELQTESGRPVVLEFREMALGDMLDAAERGDVDLASAALTVNSEREKRMDFTHPIHNSGLGIAVRTEQRSGWSGVIDRLFSVTFLEVIAGVLGAMFVSGTLMYLFERRANPEQFGGGWLRGIGTGLWWSAVTATTVGYGDKAPRTAAGRFVALVWMFGGILIITSFMAAVTATLTVTQLNSRVSGPRDLVRVRVATVADSTAAAYLTSHHVAFSSHSDVRETLEALRRGEVDAVVYDAPVLRYLTHNDHTDQLHVLPTIFHRQEYAFAMKSGSPLRERINQILLSKIETPEWEQTLNQYLGISW